MAFTTGLLGAVVLSGWMVGNRTLTAVYPTFVSMKANTALGFLMAAVALVALRHPHRRAAVAGTFCATMVTAIGLGTVAEYVSGRSLGIDELLFQDADAVGTGAPGRMAPTTAVCFVLLGTALLSGRLRRRSVAAERLLTAPTVLVVLVGYLNLAGYAYSAPGLYGIGAMTKMAVHTAAGFVLIGVAFLLADRDAVVPRNLASRGAGGKLCRLVLPTALLILPVLGRLETLGMQKGLYDAATGNALSVIAATVVLTAVISLAVRSLNWEERQRTSAERALADLNRDLELTVDVRTKNLKSAVSDLTAANAQLESFSYSVSHDLRGPLRSVMGFAHALVEDEKSLSVEARHFVDRIVTGAEAMNKLTEDLLDFARSGRDPLRRETIRLDDIVAELADLIRDAEGERVTVAWKELPPCLADANLLRQVLWNLLDNAVKFSRTRHEAVIEVSGTREGTDCVYCVTDNGVGFDTTYSSQLFGAFKRLHGRTEFDGSGIGLAIVERIVDRHGGRVWADSDGSSGATVCFSIPGGQHE